MGVFPAAGELIALGHDAGGRSRDGPCFDEMVFQGGAARVERAGRQPVFVSAADADPDGEISGVVAAPEVGVVVFDRPHEPGDDPDLARWLHGHLLDGTGDAICSSRSQDRIVPKIVFDRVDVVLPVRDIDLVRVARPFIELMTAQLADYFRGNSRSFPVSVPDVDDHEPVLVLAGMVYSCRALAASSAAAYPVGTGASRSSTAVPTATPTAAAAGLEAGQGG